MTRRNASQRFFRPYRVSHRWRLAGPRRRGNDDADTLNACGRTDTGFARLFNYNLVLGGTHRVDAYADGALFGSATFEVGYLGSEFLLGLDDAHRIPDFPSKGQSTRVEWAQSKQPFVITDIAPTASGSLVGTYALT